MDNLDNLIQSTAKKEGEYGFYAWLLIHATLKKLLSTGRISTEELDGIFEETSKIYDAIPRISAERFDSLLEISSKIITDED